MKLGDLLNLPIVKPTTTPTAEDLATPERRWCIVLTANGHAYLGRLSANDLELDEQGRIAGALRRSLVLEDPFDYGSGRDVVKGDDGRPRMAMHREIFPCEHFPIDRIFVVPDVVIPLASCPIKQLEALRAILIPAWDGREHLRSLGRLVATVGA